jgi:peptidoglycan hydrolase-like protein with peptidoglycan-binding domain
VQALLALRGCDPGAQDGQYGSRSQGACTRYQATHGLYQDAWVGSKTLDRLLND